MSLDQKNTLHNQKISAKDQPEELELNALINVNRILEYDIIYTILYSVSLGIGPSLNVKIHIDHILFEKREQLFLFVFLLQLSSTFHFLGFVFSVIILKSIFMMEDIITKQ
mgnify:CR=1 FL=1